MNRVIILATLVAVGALAAIPTTASAGHAHRVCFKKPGVYHNGTRIPTVCASGPRAAVAYSGHAGCPSTVPPNSTGVCAYHTGVNGISSYASTKHWISIVGHVFQCSPGPCVAGGGWSGYVNGTATLSNNSSTTTLTDYYVIESGR